MNRTGTWIFVCAVGAVSVLEVALAAFNYAHHGRWMWIVGPLVLALGMSLQGLSAMMRNRGKPKTPSLSKSPPSRRLAGPGGVFHRR
jgi:hypothetical protein